MYSVSAYGRMIADSVRVGAYQEAMRRVVTPDSVVLEIGTGTGLFAFLACQMGARKVYAVETSEAISLAERAARDNGFEDRIEFLQELSTNVTLPEKADILVSDLHGITPLLTQHIPSVIDARARLLRPGATILPGREYLHAALVEAPGEYERITGPWAAERHGLDWSATMAVVRNDFYKYEARKEELLSAPREWTSLDYATVSSPSAARTLEFEALRPGTAHGFLLWFDCELLPGIGFSNAPGGDGAIYQSAFYPFEQPLRLESGEPVELHLRADLFGPQYVWSWKVRSPRTQFSQSTMRSIVTSARSARVCAPRFQPRLNATGEAVRWLLGRMDGETSNQEIATELAAAFPTMYRTASDAMPLVVEMATRFT